MSWSHVPVYKTNILKFLRSIKPYGNTELQVLKNECNTLFESARLDYRPKGNGNDFYVTEVRADVNNKNVSDLVKLQELKKLLLLNQSPASD